MATKLSAAIFGPEATGTLVLRFLAESAYLRYYRGQLDQAVAAFKALVLLMPDAAIGHQGLAEVYMSQSKFREADREAELAAKSPQADRRTTAFAYRVRGKAMIQMNRLKDAEKSLIRAAEMDAGGEEGKAAQVLLDACRRVGVFPAVAAKA